VGTVAAVDPLPAGAAVWYLSKKNPTPVDPVFIMVAGQVANDATRTMKILPGLNMIANPYPVDLPLNPVNGFGLGVQPGMVSVSQANDCDQIQIYDPVGRTYLTSRTLRTISGNTRWSVGTAVATDVIPAGGSAWYLSKATDPEGFYLMFDTPVED